MTIVSKAIYRCNTIKLPMAFFTELEQKKNLKICMETQKTPKNPSILKKKNGTGGINLLDFRLYYKATVIRTIWYWNKDRNTDQWNKIERPEINPHTRHLVFGRGGKNLQWKKDNLFNNWCWENWSTMWKRMKVKHFLTPYTKNKLKMD